MVTDLAIETRMIVATIKMVAPKRVPRMPMLGAAMRRAMRKMLMRAASKKTIQPRSMS